MALGGGNNSEYFVKGALTFSIMTMLLMTSFLIVFAPPTQEVKGYQQEMDELLSAYYDATGNTVQNEQIWGLTGIYTPYGISANGSASTKQIVLKDGWIAGDRVDSYSPSQYSTSNLNGKQNYTVTYDSGKGLYYYTAHGDDLGDITNGTVETPHTGTLYTSVTMELTKRSNIFFTVGNRQEMENGTFYYNYSGYRYCFQSLSDYYYDASTPISHTDTSLSLIWYNNVIGDSGISGQMVLAGSDSGVAYITAQQIVTAFNSANYTSKFTMAFNGIQMNIYVQLSAYAITHGYSVEDCYNNGWWSVLVTSPMVSSGADKQTNSFDKFDPERVFDIVIGLLSFKSDNYGLTGVAGTIASTVFSVSLYTSLIAVGLTFWPVLLIAAALATFQTLGISGLWPF